MAHGILATLGATSLNKLEFWDIQSKSDSVKKSTIRDNISVFSPLREISCDSHVTVMTVVNDMVVVGDDFGQVCVYDGSPKAGGCLQRFRDHKGAITDIYAVRTGLCCFVSLRECCCLSSTNCVIVCTSLVLYLFNTHCMC